MFFDQNIIFQTQIDGIPNDQLSTLPGLPNKSFPVIAPGPTAKNSHDITIIQALGFKLLLAREVLLKSEIKSWNFCL